jgi:peptidoglycan/LPS O-acetylase OafA/YrhL
MGVIRFLLAMSVVLGHAPGWGKTTNILGSLHPYYAVQAFFVISGFYVSLIIHQKYLYRQNWIKKFYLNRYLRLFPSYFIVMLFTMGLVFMFPGTLPYLDSLFDGGNSLFLWNNDLVQTLKVCFIYLTNFFIFGQDLPHFFYVSGHLATNFLLVSQGWSLGSELWFYAVSPLLVKVRVKVLLILCVLSFVVRYTCDSVGLPFFPWQQRFFFCEIMLFIFGMLAYRFYNLYLIKSKKHEPIKYILLFVSSVAIMCNEKYFPRLVSPHYSGTLMVGAGTMVVIPFLFHYFRDSNVDRFIGELSYPVYLLHIVVGYFIEPSQRYWHGFLLLILSTSFSIPLILFVEIPMQRFRKKLLERKEQPLAKVYNRAFSL